MRRRSRKRPAPALDAAAVELLRGDRVGRMFLAHLEERRRSSSSR